MDRRNPLYPVVVALLDRLGGEVTLTRDELIKASMTPVETIRSNSLQDDTMHIKVLP